LIGFARWLLWWAWAALLVLPFAAIMRAGGDDIQLPVVQPPDFSNLVGQYRFQEVSASRTNLFTDQATRLKVVIAGTGPAKYQPRRPDLHIFRPELKKNFYIEPLPKEDRHDAAKGTWEFSYNLKPRGLHADRIPALKLTYYNPQTERFQSTYSKGIKLHIQQRPKVIVAPERMYELTTGAEVLRSTNQEIPWGLLLVWVLAVPLGCAVGYGLWRYWYPCAAVQAGRRRSRAARQALHALGRVGDDPLGERTAGVVIRYLHLRLPLTTLEPTGLEVERTFLQVGLPAELAQQASAFFQACEDARFAPPEVARDRPLQSAAIALVENLERASC
jgi:hypothetical protein